MQNNIPTEDIVRALLGAHQFQFQDKGAYLEKGVCPSCGKKELFIKKAEPWVVKCNRMNNCGWTENTRELFPEVFANFSERYPKTEQEPHRTADMYLSMDRGFDLSKIRGWYTQETYKIPNTNDYCETIRFYLDANKTRYWERLIDKTKQDGQKANFSGQRKPDGSLFKGDVWSPPDLEVVEHDSIYIVEGILHALALHHKGKKAVAALTSGNFPTNFIEAHKEKKINWVLALDGDKAGRTYMPKHAKKLRTMNQRVSVCLLPDGKQDWDDLYRAKRLSDYFFESCFYNGKLFMAENVEEKAYVHYCKNKRNRFIIDFKESLYAINVESALQGDLASDGLELESDDGRQLFSQHCMIDIIANIRPEFLYMERDEIMDEQKYIFRISYGNGSEPTIIGMEGTNITSPDAFHKALLNRTSGGTFDGDSRQLKILRDGWLNRKMKVVQSIPFVGYDKDTKAYIYQNHAYNSGKEIPLNDHSYFEVGARGIKTSLNGVSINTKGKFDPTWLDNYIKAFSMQGLTVLSFWLGTLFVQQIRQKHKTFPFLEFTGEPGAGKSTVLEFLWKLTGRDDYEGFDIMKASYAGRRRAFNQLSNLPVVLIESDRDSGEKDAKAKQFNFDECKPFYNGRGTGTLGVARRNNDVEEHLFQASLIISQNAQVDGSEALLQRIVHCHADKSHHKNGTRDIARFFERQSSDTVGGFLRAALQREKEILLAYEKAYDAIERDFTGLEIKNERIIKNHAQVAACGAALAVLFPTMDQTKIDNLKQYIYDRALAREQRLAADHPVIEAFWDSYNYLNEDHHTVQQGFLNHSVDPKTIAINLNQFRQLCQQQGQELPDLKQLKALLPHSRRHKFIQANKGIRSSKLEKTVRCWTFEK
ncbi:MAG: toprim domain-containing protein [Desulfovibrio sp.]